MPNTTLSQDKDALLADLKTLIEDTEKLMQHSASLAGEQADELNRQIRSGLERARENLYATESTLRERGKEHMRATEHYVQEHPLQSLGICAGVGFLLGLLVSRR